MVAKTQAGSLPDVAAGIPGPGGARMCAEAPFKPEREREIVLRRDTTVAQRELVGELGPRGQPAAERIFKSNAHGKRPQRFVAAVTRIKGIIDLGRADAAAPVGTEER